MHCSLRDMSIFVAAYEERSFTAAAQRENATQSGVSQHMGNLEYMLGVQLFLRKRGGVTPTPAAERFYRSCLQVLRAHTNACREMTVFAKSEVGDIRIGLMPTITRRVLSPVLESFLAELPNVNVRVVEGYSAVLSQMVQAGELDCAVVPAAETASGLTGRPLVQVAEVLVSRHDGPLQHLAPVDLRDLPPLKIVLPNETNLRRQRITSYCAAHGIEIDTILELDSMLCTLDIVSQTDRVTVLPSLMMGHTAGARTHTVNPIVSPELHLELMVIEPIRTPLSPPAARFIALLEAEAQARAVSWAAVMKGV